MPGGDGDNKPKDKDKDKSDSDSGSGISAGDVAKTGLTILTHLGDIKSAFSDFDNGDIMGGAKKLINIFCGGDGGTAKILDALNALSAAVTKGMTDIQVAINDQTQFQRWQPFSSKLTAWNDTIQSRALELRNIDPVKQTVPLNGRDVSIIDWCEGEALTGGSQVGVLDELGKVVGDMAVWVTSGSAGADSPFKLWMDLTELAAKGQIQGFAGRQRYWQLIDWYQSLYGLVQSAIYVRSAALRLYRAKLAEMPDAERKKRDKVKHPTYGGLDNYLGKFGSLDDPNSVWGTFETQLAKWRALDPYADRGICASTSYDDPAGNPQYDLMTYKSIENASGQRLGNKIWGALFLTQEVCAPPGGYLTALRLSFFSIATDYPVWCFQAQGTVLDANGNSKPTGILTPSKVKPGVLLMPGEYYLMTNKDQIGIGTGYFENKDVRLGDGRTQVVTGARFETTGDMTNTLVLALQFGVLDTNRGVPVVRVEDTRFYKPTTLTNKAMLANQINHFDGGWALTDSEAPMTTATLLPMGDRMTILARSTWQNYRSNFVELARLKAYSR